MSVLETNTRGLPVLQQRLKTTTRVRMLSWLCAGLALAAASLVAAFSVYSVIDLTWHLSPFGRTTAVVLTGLCAFGMVAVGLMQAWRQSRDLTHEAIEVQTANPVLGNALSASLLYGADAELTRRESSPAIVDRLVQSTTAVAREAAFNRAVSWKTPKRYALLALALFLIALTAAQMNMRIFSLTLSRFLNPWADLPAPTWTALGAVGPFGTRENHWKVPAGAAVTVTAEVVEHDPGEAYIETRTDNSDWLRRKMYRLPAASGATGEATPRYGYDFDNLLSDVQYRVLCGDAQTGSLAIPVMIDPQLANLEVTITPPAFLHRPPTVLRGIGDVDALKGSQVEIRARANKELQSGALALHTAASPATSATTATTATPNATGKSSATVPATVGTAPYAAACEAARAETAKHPGATVDVPIGATDHDVVAHFNVEQSGSYTLALVDPDGKHNTDELRYTIKCRDNAPAKVKITAPGKDVSVKNDATVAIDLEAEDDFALREVGLYLMVGRQIERKSLQRLADGKTATRTSYDLELAHRGFQGGEVITYWAFAVDEDGTPNGREVTSEPQFLMTYAENDFAGQSPPKQPAMSKQSQKAMVGLDQLIDRQKDTIRDTFGLYMQMGLSLDRSNFAKAAGADGAAAPTPAPTTTTPPATPSTPGTTGTAETPAPAPANPANPADLPPADVKPEQASRATTLGASQSKIQSDLKQLVADVREELAKLAAEQQAHHGTTPGPDGGADAGGDPTAPGGGGGGGGADGGAGGGDPNQLGAKELALLDQAAAKMDEVQPPLKNVRPDSAVKPENEALRLMSEARKMILSKNGQGSMKLAMDSANRKKQQRDQQQQDQQAQQTAQEMRKIPPMLDDADQMMDDAKKLEKRLDDQKKQADQQAPEKPPATPEEKKADENRKLAHKQDEEENRRLQKKMADQAQDLANRAKESADRMREMNKQDGANKETRQNRDQAAEKMEQASRKLAQAGQKSDQAKNADDAAQAKQDMADAQNAMKDAAGRMNQSMSAQNRERLANAVKDAQDLEQRQQQLGQDTKQQAQDKQAQDKQGQDKQAQTPGPSGQPQADAQQKQNAQAQGNLAHEQKGLENDLSQLRDRMNDLADQLEQNAPAGSPQAKAAEDLKNAAKNAESRSDVQRDMNNAAKELQNGALDKAQDKQAAAAQGLSAIRRQLEQAEARNSGAARDQLNKAINDLADLHREINQARQNPAAATPETTQPLADRAGDLAKQMQDLAGADDQTRRDAAQNLNQARATLKAPASGTTHAPDATNPKQAEDKQLGDAGQQVADASKQLQRALQNLDANQVQKTQALVDKTLGQQHASDQAMQQAADAKAAQAAAQAAADAAKTAPAPDATKPAADTAKAAQAAQAAQAAAAKANAAADTAKTQQADAAQGAKEIDQALKRLQTYLNGGKDTDPTKPDPAAPATPATAPNATDANARQLAQTLADQFDQQKIPENTRALSGKVEELAGQQKSAADAATKPTDPGSKQDPSAKPDPAQPQTAGPAVKPDDAAKQWQDHKAAGEKVEADLADVRQRLDQLQAAIDRDELKRLEAAKEAIQAMQNKLDAGQPAANATKPDANTPDPNKPGQPAAPATTPLSADELKQMNKDLAQMQGDLKRLNLDEKTLAALEKANADLRQSLQQTPTPNGTKPTPDGTKPTPTGEKPNPTGKPDPSQPSQPAQMPGQPKPEAGQQPNFATNPASQQGAQELKFVRGGLDRAIERVLEDRRINGEQEDQAPKRFNALVDKYFETLSDEQIDRKTNAK